MEIETYNQMIIFLKDTSQMLFFITSIIIAILTYISARRTIFNPIRTEIFKKQMEFYNQIEELFSNKINDDFFKMFEYKNIIELNFLKILQQKAIEKYGDSCKSFELFNAEKFKDLAYFDNYKTFNGKEHIEFKDIEPVITNNPYNLPLRGTKKFFKQIKKIMKIAESPFVPKDISIKLKQFTYDSMYNFAYIPLSYQLALNDLAFEKLDFETIDPKIIDNIWELYLKHAKLRNLEKSANDIMIELNKYIKNDKFIERGLKYIK